MPPLFPQRTVTTIASTNGTNGDTNPYGIAVVPKTEGTLVKGDLLVADFNSSSVMGGGTTIVQVNPQTGATSVFYQDASITGPVAIAINPTADIVWVSYYGSPSDGSGSGYAVISNTGGLIANYNNTDTSYDGSSDLFDASWGAAGAPGAFFWTNAGTTGQVWRLNPHPGAASNGQPISADYTPLATDLPTAAGAGTSLSPSAVAGPEGMVWDARTNTLYVTDDYNNAIYALPNALTATGPIAPVMIAEGGALMSPQQIALDTNNNHLLVVNGAGNNNLVELTTSGRVIGTRSLDPNAPGALFGLATTTDAHHHLAIYFDDSNTSTLDGLTGRPIPPMPPSPPTTPGR